jgi:hypothetical protein
VFENRVLRRIFGPKRDEVTGEWRKLHNEEFRDMNSSVGKPEGKRPLRRPRRRWVDNNRMDLGVIGWGGVVWIGPAQDRDKYRALVNAAMNFLGHYQVAAQLVASRVMLSSIELVTYVQQHHLRSRGRGCRSYWDAYN